MKCTIPYFHTNPILHGNCSINLNPLSLSLRSRLCNSLVYIILKTICRYIDVDIASLEIREENNE